MKISKKLFYFLFVFLLVFTFAGCTKKETEETVAPTKTQTKQEEPTKVVTPVKNESISFSIKVVDIDGEELGSKDIVTDESFDGNLFTELCKNFEVEYSNSDYGPYITSINGSVVDGNYYLAFYENHEYSMVGVSSAVVDDGDVFEFVVETWQPYDDVDKLVDKVIYSMLKNNLNDYFLESGFSYPLLASLSKACHAESYGYSLYDESVYNLNINYKDNYIQAYSGDLSNEVAISPLLRGAMVMNIYDSGNDTIEVGLNKLELASLNNLFVAPYYLMACSLNGTTPNSELMDSYEALLEYEKGSDSILLALQAYQLYASDFENFATVSEDVLAKQSAFLTENGFNDEWGGVNSCSTAQLILTLLAYGKDVRSYNDVDLVNVLLSYYKDGAFLYQADSTEADMLYSSPQAFAALISYKLCRDTGEFNNIYSSK